jgi:hypothetical protein
MTLQMLTFHMLTEIHARTTRTAKITHDILAVGHTSHKRPQVDT